MLIKIVAPIYSEDGNLTVKKFEEEINRELGFALQPDVNISFSCLRAGPTSIECFFDEKAAVPYILEEVVRAEKENQDAVIINCFGDPGLWAAREIAKIPVVGAGQASLLIASFLGEKVAIVTVVDKVCPLIRRNIRLYHLDSIVTSIRAVQIPVLEIEKKLDYVEDVILKESQAAIEKDGADVIVLGCTGFTKLSRKLYTKLSVPVVDPTLAAIKLAEMTVRRGLSQSKRKYPEVCEKERRGFTILANLTGLHG
ncbi:hydrogenase expression protein HupH [Thermoanaerobacteraceae bacterium SP2]|nr:hydrogenase expression protein HupH [Thermoanaerobacteraceae bacterium SP2]